MVSTFPVGDMLTHAAGFTPPHQRGQNQVTADNALTDLTSVDALLDAVVAEAIVADTQAEIAYSA